MAYQKVIIKGNLGGDIDMRHADSGTAVANFSVAVGEKWKGKDDQQQEHTEWFRCTAFGNTAENLSKFFSKGSGIMLEGKMRTNKYQDKNNGEDRYSTSLIVQSFDFVDRKSDGGQGDSQQSAPPQNNDFDDDIPFAPVHWMG